MTEVEIGVLHTARLDIVPLDRAAFDAYMSDPALDTELRAAMAELAERADADAGGAFSWYTNRMLVRRADGVTVGSAAFMSNPHHDSEHYAEIGYGVDEAYRGQGYATEAVCAMAEAALSIPQTDGVIAGVEIGNRASERVLEKSGFRRTDRSRRLGLEIYMRYRPGDARAKKPGLFSRMRRHLANKRHGNG